MKKEKRKKIKTTHKAHISQEKLIHISQEKLIHMITKINSVSTSLLLTQQTQKISADNLYINSYTRNT